MTTKKNNRPRSTPARVEGEATPVLVASAKPRAQKQATNPSRSVTPSMAQFLEIKAANPDCILWYRMGDFYELFFEDAKVVSQALSITLTKRGKHLGEDIPMCGVPVVRADEYLHKLIKQGFRVAVCEQLESPAEAKKRGSKSVVKRDVVRLVTPGTLTEDTLLEATSGNFLSAVFFAPDGQNAPPNERQVALVSIDISTGEFEIGNINTTDLPGELVRISPSELIVSDRQDLHDEIKPVIAMLGTSTTPVPHAHFSSMSGERDLKALFKVADLGAFGSFDRAELAAVSALLKYVDFTQIGAKPFTRPPKRTSTTDVLMIDAASRASLELTRSSSGAKNTTLLSCIDRTVTAHGARELASRLSKPLRDVAKINARLEAITFLLEAPTLRDDLRADLRTCPDVARAISRLKFQRGSPKDLANIRDALNCADQCASRLQSAPKGIENLPDELERIEADLASIPKGLAQQLNEALVDTPPNNKRDGNFIRDGFNAKLDETKRLKASGHNVMAEMEARYIKQTGTKNLKIRHNNILGYFIEVSKSNAGELAREPHASVFRHRQSIANAARFTTDELDETQTRISTADERAQALEIEIFDELANAIVNAADTLAAIASALAQLDVTAALAHLATHENYARPKVDTSHAFNVKGGRHPVVEQALKASHQNPFIENDCCLSRDADQSETTITDTGNEPPPGFDDGTAGARAQFIWLITGPNMAGKSTYLRQNALITILAQMGSYVPARDAHIGVVDRLFSRVGASDDLARGRSTFMVEMVETASILNLATDRSLIILDEIGRGTATYDGLSIAWACIEYLHDVAAARTLFATHYHELTTLPERLKGLANVTVDVKEWHDEIIFLHKVRPGAADRSYGIQVAKLAGLPAAVVERANAVLHLLETHNQTPSAGSQNLLDELPLFAASRPAPSENTNNEQPGPLSDLKQELEQINPDDLTPRAALDALYRLKDLAKPKDS